MSLKLLWRACEVQWNIHTPAPNSHPPPHRILLRFVSMAQEYNKTSLVQIMAWAHYPYHGDPWLRRIYAITMMSQWARWLLKSTSRLFTQPFIQAQIKENLKAPPHWPLCGEFTGDRWIPRTEGQERGKCFHLMTSSWRHSASISYTTVLLRYYVRFRLHSMKFIRINNLFLYSPRFYI